jgi:hypothetical protein
MSMSRGRPQRPWPSAPVLLAAVSSIIAIAVAIAAPLYRRECAIRELSRSGVDLYGYYPGPKSIAGLLEHNHVIGTATADCAIVYGPGVVDDELALLQRCGPMRSITVWSTAKVTDRGMAHLRGLTRMQRLCIIDADIGDPGIGHLSRMTSLESLEIGRTHVTDAAIDHLVRIGTLKYIALDSDSVTGVGIARLHSMLPGATLSINDGTRMYSFAPEGVRLK